MNTKFEKKYLNRKDHRINDILATIIRISLTPIMLLYRVYLWVWDDTMFKELSSKFKES